MALNEPRLDPNGSGAPQSHPPARTVLIVEDAAESRDVFATVLRHHGYRVLEARDGAEGVRMATEKLPDLVLMNIEVPIVNGVDATEILKEHPRTSGIPVLVVSGHMTPAVVDMAWGAGCDDYLQKPLAPSALLREVQQRIGPAVA